MLQNAVMMWEIFHFKVMTILFTLTGFFAHTCYDTSRENCCWYESIFLSLQNMYLSKKKNPKKTAEHY